MNGNDERHEQSQLADSRFVLLERITAAVLLLVVGALGWLLLAAEDPRWTGGIQDQAAVIGLLALLTVSLLLVSVVALLHTRKQA